MIENTDLPRTNSIVVMGDLMVDVCAQLESLESLAQSRGSDLPSQIIFEVGGSAANTASWLAFSGVPTHFLGAIGDDALGATVTERFAHPGLTLLVEALHEYPTGTCIVLTEGSGERTMIPSPGANAYLSTEHLSKLWPQVQDQAPRHLHVSGYALFHVMTGETVLAAMHLARSQGLTVSFDPSAHTLIELHCDRIRAALSLTDVLLANEEEAIALGKAFLQKDSMSGSSALGTNQDFLTLANDLRGLLNQSGAGTCEGPAVVITRGPHGAVAAEAKSYSVPAHFVEEEEIRSTTGAGDAFNAGFLRSWLATFDTIPALNSGAQLASQALYRVGASPYALD